MAKKISMMENTPKGDMMRDYFLACEKKLQEVVQLPVPTDTFEALRLFFNATDEKFVKLEERLDGTVNLLQLYEKQINALKTNVPVVPNVPDDPNDPYMTPKKFNELYNMDMSKSEKQGLGRTCKKISKANGIPVIVLTEFYTVNEKSVPTPTSAYKRSVIVAACKEKNKYELPEELIKN
jgi:hypothetical protein